jgi:uncharacterized protein YfiM (DUF2279 family)|tara:strand:+ start:93 stop:485 length:393 start_codon:yes stop_codon:yes gene_type:complete
LISYFIKNIGDKKKRSFIFFFVVLMSFSYGSQDSLSINKKNNTLVDEWFAIDKVQHFMYSAFVSLGTQYVLVNKIQMDEQGALPLSSLLSFSAGLLKEVHDNSIKNGFFSKKDMVANSFGILFAGMMISL